MSLFRKEVLEKQGEKHFGDVFLLSPINLWAILFLILMIVAGFFCFAVFGEYARKERVSGILTPDKGLVRIIPPQAGIIEAIRVKSSERVSEGQALFSIKYDTNLKEGQSVSVTLLDSMLGDKSNLTARLEGLTMQYVLTERRLLTRKKELTKEATRLLEQIKTQQQLIRLEEDVSSRINDLLAEEAASELEAITQEKIVIQSRQTLNTIRNSRARILSEVKDVNEQIALLPYEKSQAETDLKNQLASLNQMITRTEAGGKGIIISPIDGTIASITIKEGQVISTQQTAISILPLGGELRAALFVPTRAAGFIKKGQSIRLLYDAFPYQKFGFHNGTITDVSKSVVNASDVALVPLFTQPVFLVIAKLDSQGVDARGDTFPLQAGMSLSADIILEERKVWEWVLEPFLGGDK